MRVLLVVSVLCNIILRVSYVERSCEYGSHCGVSLNTGGIKQSIICCRTDLCNNHTLPESKNGMECYGCTEASCRGDLKKIECTSNQEYCASGYFKGSFDRFSPLLLDSVRNKSARENLDVRKGKARFPFRGCVSMEVCGLPISSLDEISCCCGNLCNRSVSAQHNMLLLLVTGLLPSLRMPL
ncbi:uncharacterized protein LOC125487956 isoform X2 [Rhincodon typus]|uniref:uncharacterized protein LOC125487956 isoform X2 n=1 Tax=Rhincodon typus TaxID=259920 RepID=UPI00203036AA|nr:uncharacterized protein LOC125487956 isoform X2 [Rhincodon typus]